MVVVTGLDDKERVLADAIRATGLSVEKQGGGSIGLCCFDVSDLDATGAPDEELVARWRAMTGRCAAMALVGIGLEDCPTWPARMARAARILDPDGRCPVFAVALGVAAGDLAGSGVPELVGWVVEVADQNTRVAAGQHTVERLTGLRLGSAATRSWAGSRIHAGFRELVSVGQESATRLRNRDVEAFIQWLSEASARLEHQLVGSTADQAAYVRATALVGLEAYDRHADPMPTPPGPVSTVAWPRRGWGAEDAVLVLIGATSGLGVGRLAAGSVVGWLPGWLAVVVGVLIGLTVAGLAVALRRRVLLRNQARAWVIDVAADARARTEWRVAALLNGFDPAVAAQVRRAGTR